MFQYPSSKITYDQYLHEVHTLGFSDDNLNFRCNKCTMWSTPIMEPPGDDAKERAYTMFRTHLAACPGA